MFLSLRLQISDWIRRFFKTISIFLMALLDMKTDSSSLTSSSSSAAARWNYEVFLSFRGEDTRSNFASYLFEALRRKGISTFKDDKNLEKGKPISSELLKAIRGSRFAIVIISKDYASSAWCLNELVHIIHCKSETGMIVLPVFYYVEPSDVRNQMGTFEQAFIKHENEDKETVKKWRDALRQVGNLAGFPLKNDRSETEYIEEIVRWIPPLNDYEVMSKEVLKYAAGLPLTLKVLGSSFGKSTILWRSALESIKENPNKQVLNLFQISFDGLDDLDKEIFLHIACFFSHEEEDHTVEVLDSLGLHPGIGLQELIDKSLLKIDDKGKLWMHDLLEEMGKSIVCQECPNDCGNCNRLWNYEDIKNVLKKIKGNEVVQAMCLHQAEASPSPSPWCLSRRRGRSRSRIRIWSERRGSENRSRSRSRPELELKPEPEPKSSRGRSRGNGGRSRSRSGSRGNRIRIEPKPEPKPESSQGNGGRSRENKIQSEPKPEPKSKPESSRGRSRCRDRSRGNGDRSRGNEGRSRSRENKIRSEPKPELKPKPESSRDRSRGNGGRSRSRGNGDRSRGNGGRSRSRGNGGRSRSRENKIQSEPKPEPKPKPESSRDRSRGNGGRSRSRAKPKPKPKPKQIKTL